MKNIPNPYDSLGNANPNKSVFFNPNAVEVNAKCNCICLRFYGDNSKLDRVTITLLDDTTVNFSDLRGYDLGDWHWYRFKNIAIPITTNLLVEAVEANIGD